MSRIGKKIIAIPEKTEFAVVNGEMVAKGPLGELRKSVNNSIDIKIENKQVTLAPVKDTLESRALWGTYAAHVMNMLKGVNQVFQKKLIVEGIGFKSDVKGDEMVLALGFSHPVKVKIPKALKVTAEKNVITVSGMNKELVGQFVAEIRDLKKPEPYKGKGIRYENEVIRRKQGKKSV